MADIVISLDDAARQFPEIVAKAQGEQVSFIIVEKGRALARLSPAHRPARTCAELADRIESRPRLSKAIAEGWERELALARTQ